jgi:hypothetical protein
MAANNAMTESDGFSAAERAAMKERASELRAEGKKGAKKADGLQAVLDRIAEMAPQDPRAIAGAARSGMTQAEIVELAGYPADRVLRICRDAGISGD